MASTRDYSTTRCCVPFPVLAFELPGDTIFTNGSIEGRAPELRLTTVFHNSIGGRSAQLHILIGDPTCTVKIGCEENLSHSGRTDRVTNVRGSYEIFRTKGAERRCVVAARIIIRLCYRNIASVVE